MTQDNHITEALIGIGVWQAAENTRQQAEYQRQQLNLLRAHQGLPPIPPPPPPTWGIFEWILFGPIILAVVGFALAVLVVIYLNLWPWLQWVIGVLVASIAFEYASEKVEWWRARRSAKHLRRDGRRSIS